MTFRPHPGLYGQSWIALTICGRYAIRTDNSDPRATKFAALFIPGVWANAEELGVRPTQEAAQALCEKYAAKQLSIKRIAHLAKGVN